MSERSRYQPPIEQLPVATELRRATSFDTSLITMEEEIRKTQATVLHGTKTEVVRLEPADLIFLFEEILKWLPVAEQTSLEERDYLKRFLETNIITLGEAAKSTDTEKKGRYISKLVTEIRRHRTLLAEIYSHHEQAQTHEQESSTDTSFFDTFDPSVFTFETISEHTERLMLSIASVLEKREHKETYLPILESLDRAIAQSLQATIQETNRTYYTPGRIRLADIKSRMPQEHWGILCTFWHTYPELYQHILGKLPDEIDSTHILLKHTHTKNPGDKNSHDIAIANVLCIALSEEIKAANKGNDSVRPSAQKILDEWYGPHKPKDLLDHEDILWNVTLTKAIQTIQDTAVRDRFLDIQKKLPRRITKDSCLETLTTLEAIYTELSALQETSLPQSVRTELEKLVQRYTKETVAILEQLCTDIHTLSVRTQTQKDTSKASYIRSALRYLTTYARDRETYHKETIQKEHKTKAQICDILRRIQTLSQHHPQTITPETIENIIQLFFTKENPQSRLFREDASRHDITEAEVNTVYDLSSYQAQLPYISLSGIDLRYTRLPDDCSNISFSGAYVDTETFLHILQTQKDMSGVDLQDTVLHSTSTRGFGTRPGPSLTGVTLYGAKLPKDCRYISFSGAKLGSAEIQHILQTDRDLRYINVAGQDLSGVDFRYALLCKAEMSGTNLSRANLNGTDLRGANLSGAILPENCKDIKFFGTKLGRAEVTHILRTNKDLSGVNLSGADLSGVNLSGVNLRGTDLSGVNLSGADLSWTKLSGADLSGADLSGVLLNRTDLSGVNLRGTDLSRTKLGGADLHGANLSGANLSDADLRDANLRWTDLSGVDLRGANLCEVDLRWANLSGANLRDADLSGADLRWAGLRDADLSDADLSDADLSGAGLRDADLSDADLSGAGLRDADLNGAELPEDCTGISFVGTHLDKQQKTYIRQRGGII